MTTNKNLPELAPEALRDHGSDDRLDRIWQRLEGELDSSRPRPRQAWAWAPAALVLVFGAGVFVGARWVRPSAPVTSLSAEPASAGDEVRRPGQAPAAPEPTRLDDAPHAAREKKPSAPQGLLAPGEPAGVVPAEQAAPPTASLPPVLASPEWQVLADRDDYAAAWKAVEAQGGFDAVLARASGAAQLMSLVDIARANGQRGAAMKALRTVVDKHPRDPRAALAAYTLGDMLEKAGDRAGAARAYAAYRALSPKGDFAEDALARQIDAAIAQGDVDLARQLAEQYAKDFPTGRRLGEIRARVGKLAGLDAGAVASDAGAGEDDTPFDEVDEEEVRPGAKPGSRPAPGPSRDK